MKTKTEFYGIPDGDGFILVKRFWEGREWLGLPGGEIADGDSGSAEARVRDILAPRKKTESDMAIIYSLGREERMGAVEGYSWNGNPVTLEIVSFPDADIMAPMNNRATWVSTEEILADNNGKSFDVTVEALRKLIRASKSASVTAA